MTPGPRRVARPRLTQSLGFVAICLAAACSDHDKPAGAAAAGSAAPAPPQTVTVITLQPETLPIGAEWIATLDGNVNAQIRPQVSGYLIKKTYDEGSSVKKDQMLFEIDARPFQAALAQAAASLARAKADLGRAERDVARDTPLAKEHAIPQSQLDNDTQSQLAAEASVKAAQAAIDAAQLNLGFTRVRSLIDGVAAIASAQIGDLVNPSTLLTTVSQVDPIKAYFSISEQEYLRAAKQLNQRGKAELWQDNEGLELTLADGSKYPPKGHFLAADRQVDPRTGTIRISATFPNPDNILRPGLYGRIHAQTSMLENALLVPQRAVSELQGSAQVRIVGPDNKAMLRNVKLGVRVGTRWVVQEGLAAGDRVILDAPQMRDGTPVNPTQASASTQALNGPLPAQAPPAISAATSTSLPGPDPSAVGPAPATSVVSVSAAKPRTATKAKTQEHK
ncbi:MAG TPA: efflux RND transporter periplasmic adaptor subunit [Polyangiaceae bacterium]|nr:efflux RND transporter periplasmic adaptor subunit [Polyangiaceae bacterium]